MLKKNSKYYFLIESVKNMGEISVQRLQFFYQKLHTTGTEFPVDCKFKTVDIKNCFAYTILRNEMRGYPIIELRFPKK